MTPSTLVKEEEEKKPHRNSCFIVAQLSMRDAVHILCNRLWSIQNGLCICVCAIVMRLDHISTYSHDFHCIVILNKTYSHITKRTDAKHYDERRKKRRTETETEWRNRKSSINIADVRHRQHILLLALYISFLIS